MLRAGVTVRPKVRGNKHNMTPVAATSNGFHTMESRNAAATRPFSSYRDSSAANGFNHSEININQTLPRHFKSGRSVDSGTKDRSLFSVMSDPNNEFTSYNNNDEMEANPLPLPPRDRSRSLQIQSKTRHQRKHPLIMPGPLTNSLLRSIPGSSSAISDTSSVSSGGKSESTNTSRLIDIQHTHNPHLESVLAKMPGLIDAGPTASCKTSDDFVKQPFNDDEEMSTVDGELMINDVEDISNVDDGCLNGKANEESTFLLHVATSDEEDCTDFCADSFNSSGQPPPAKPPRMQP